METETWIERLLIDQLTRHDRRYKHDYAGVEQTTDDLATACMILDLVTTGDELEWPSFEQVLMGDAELESEVEDTLETLRERGLIERVGEQERLGPPFELGDYGTTTLWEPTVEGRAEARAIREAYSAEVEALAESYSPDSDEFRRKIGPIARTYGILPSHFR